MHTIGVLTSGGDSPGMNACVVAIARAAEMKGIGARGIIGGFRGLVEGNSIPIAGEIAGLGRRGGTFLGTSRGSDELKDRLRTMGPDALKCCGIDALVVLGGEGSLAGAALLASVGAPVVGVPCTIDNDVFGTDATIGFDTAVNKAVMLANDIVDTAEALPGRLFVLETCGGTTGHIAIATAYAVGADAVCVPEVPFSVEAASAHIKNRMDEGATHGLVVLCEMQGTWDISERMSQLTGRRTRVTALGHSQRGGNPSFRDRLLARELGRAAVERLLDGENGIMVGLSGVTISKVPLALVAAHTKPIDLTQYKAVNVWEMSLA
jgi:6-phosphofructokinase 1